MDEIDDFEFVAPIESPCLNICRVEKGVCIGCGRTLAEIARWGTTDDEDRAAVMAALPERLARIGVGSSPPG